MKYPLFIQEDEITFFIAMTSRDLTDMEDVEIKSGKYRGWDSNGYPLKISWDNDANRERIEIISDRPENDVLKQEIYKYIDESSKLYTPTKPFNYDKTSTDYVKLLRDLESHIYKPWSKIIITFFKKLFKKY